MTKNIEICKAEEVGAQVLDILGTTAERQAVAAINAAFGLAIPLPANEPGEITELPAAVSAHDRQLLAQLLGKPEPAATLSTTDPLATFVATLTRKLYRHLAERTADYLPADFPDLFARNLAHLLQAVQSLSPRKISNGSATSDGIPDGISLARLVGGDYSDVTKVVDDTPGWTAPIDAGTRIKTAFPNCKDFTLGCRVALGRLFSANDMTALTLTGLQVQNDGYLLDGNFPGLLEVVIPVVQIKSTSNWTQALLRNNSTTKILRCPNLKYMTNHIGEKVADNSKILVYDCSGIEEIYAEDLEEFCSNINGAGGIASGAPNLKKVKVGNIRIWYCLDAGPYFFDNYRNTSYDNLIDLEFKSLSCSLNLKNWTAANVLSGDNLTTFLQNFRDHICQRLADRTGQSKLTLTLSADVYTAIMADDDIKAELVARNWKVTDGTNNYNN